MRNYGTAALTTLVILLVYAAVMFGASFAGFLGETLMIVTAVVSLVVWGAFIGLTIRALLLAVAIRRGDGARLDASLRWTRSLALTAALLSIGGAFLFAFGAFATCGPTWLSGLYHWGGLVGSVLGFVAWFAFPAIVRGPLAALGRSIPPLGWRAPLITGATVYGVWGLIWLIAWLVLRGSIDTGAYPARASSPYRLPYPGGERAWVVQGNNSSFNHEGREQHSWDFRRRCGTPVLAAREGTVRAVTDSNSGHGSGKPNNFVEVTHSDGTVGRYLHIAQDSATVTVGDRVRQGDRLASVGNVGNSLTGHIHFVVESGGRSIPITFRDVEEDSGIPRTFESYTSGNSRTPRDRAPMARKR
ncbi:MAG: M23 family metallopeptidase [Myxococcaceae bacterium]|nr:M23 family metallopeptidase [Myxococcaceae bacterium]